MLIILAGSFFYFKNKNKAPTPLTSTVEKRDIRQEVNVTGRVKPSSSVDLALEKSGRIVAAYAKVGSHVTAGQLLVKLDDSELTAQLAKAKADLEANNLDNITNKANADINSVYEGAITAAQKSAFTAKNSIFTLTDIQYAHYNQTDKDSSNIAVAKEAAVLALLGQSGAGNWNNESLSPLSGGVFGDVQSAAITRGAIEIDLALSSLLNALGKIKNMLDAVPVSTVLASTEKTNLSTEKNNIASEITAISGKIQAVNIQKVTNSNNISAVSSSIKSANANIQTIEAQIKKTSLFSPIAGVVSRQDAKVGEIAGSSAPIISIISSAEFEIEADVPEADIAKLRIGQNAKATLDAYGNGVSFNTRIISIDPAEKIIDGVATYKTTFQFTKVDPRIKSGMTANIEVSTAIKEGALSLPARAIFTKNGKKHVNKFISADQSEEREIQIGIQGSDGNVEILNGLQEGDKVLIPKTE